MVSKNIKTRLNYSKAKGTSQSNHANQRNIVCMEIRLKLKTQEKTKPLRKHIKCNINQLRENAQQLLITKENEEKKEQ